MTGVKYRIGNVALGFMLAFAAAFDALQFLFTLAPFIGQALSIFLDIVWVIGFSLWCLLLRVNFFSGRKIGVKVMSLAGTAIIELLPFIQALPALTLGTLGVAVASRMEDRENHTKAAKAPVPMPQRPSSVPLAVNESPEEAPREERRAA